MEISAVIGGFKSDKHGTTPDTLFLGQYDEEDFIYIGSAEIVSSCDFLRQLMRTLDKLKVQEPTFCAPAIKDSEVNWVQPSVVIDVSCSGWCPEAGFSKPVIERLRRDVCASEIRMLRSVKR